MARLDDSVADLLSVDGALGAAVVDLDSGMVLAAGGNPGFDLEIAAAGNSNVVRAKLRTMNDLGISGGLEDMLITLDKQYHLVNVLRDGGTAGLFIYFVLNRATANLALARHKLRTVANQVRVKHQPRGPCNPCQREAGRAARGLLSYPGPAVQRGVGAGVRPDSPRPPV